MSRNGSYSNGDIPSLIISHDNKPSNQSNDINNSSSNNNSSQANQNVNNNTGIKRRGRSSSLVSLQEVTADPQETLDQSALNNHNADWVNFKGDLVFSLCS